MGLLGVIPARGGSKRLPGKNLAELGDKPLIAWTIEAALKSNSIDKLIVTTDSSEIAEIAVSYGAEVPFLRDSSLSADTTSSADMLVDVITKIHGFTNTILLQPTSPFRTTQNIDNSYAKFRSQNPYSLVSISKLHYKPSWLLKQCDQNEKIQPIFSEESDDELYVFNGAIYIVNNEQFMQDKLFIAENTIGFIMDEISSIDIDTQEDLNRARCAIQQ